MLDSGINSDVTVRLNIYQALVLSAMKMHCYLSSMRAMSSGRGGGVKATDDPRSVLVALQSAISYLFTLVKARTSTASLRFGVRCR